MKKRLDWRPKRKTRVRVSGLEKNSLVLTKAQVMGERSNSKDNQQTETTRLVTD